MNLNTVKPSFIHGPLGRSCPLSRQLVNLIHSHSPRRFVLAVRTIKILSIHGRSPRRKGRITTSQAGRRRPAGVPQLNKDEAALSVDGICHLAPSLQLGLGEYTGDAGVGASIKADVGGLGNLETAGAGAVTVVLGNARAWNMNAAGL